jgi:hypothetical protein
LFATVTCEKSRKLDTSVGVSGPHDFSVRICIIRPLMLLRPLHPVPKLRDDREAPLLWHGTAKVLGLIWVGREAEYFCEEV